MSPSRSCATRRGATPTSTCSSEREARAAANLSHPNIVTVYDYGIADGQPFIVMELVPGTNLKALLRKRGRFTVEEGIPLMVQACRGSRICPPRRAGAL